VSRAAIIGDDERGNRGRQIGPLATTLRAMPRCKPGLTGIHTNFILTEPLRDRDAGEQR
jgi:hypothetical protein